MNREIQLIKNKERLGSILFEAGLVLELLIMMTDAASWTLPYRGRLTQAAFGLFVLKILMTRYNVRQLILGGVAGLIGVASYLTCREEYVIRAVIFVIAAIGIDIGLTLKIVFYGVLASTIVIIGMSLTGVGGEIKDVRDYGRDGVIETRYCLGFSHANNVHSIIWYLAAVVILRLRDKLKFLYLFIMAAVSIVMYFFTLSRTGLAVSLLVLVLAAAVRMGDYAADRRKRDKGDTGVIKSASGVPAVPGIEDILLIIMTLLTLVVSLFLTVRAAYEFPYLNDTMEKLDRLLTGRIEMVWEHAPLYAWRLFPGGQVAELVDDGFAVIGYSYGYVVLGLLTAAIVYLSVRFLKQRDRYGQIILVSVIMMIFMESTFIFNVSLLCNMLLIICMSCKTQQTEQKRAA